MGSDLVERKFLPCTECNGTGWLLELGKPCPCCGGLGAIVVRLSLGDPKDARITELEAALSAATAERDAALQAKDGWLRAFSVQSRKLQYALPIPGVKEALAELKWSSGEPVLPTARAEAAEAEAARLREALERAKKAAQSGLDYDGDRLSDDEALTGACERVVQITSAALGGEHG